MDNSASKDDFGENYETAEMVSIPLTDSQKELNHTEIDVGDDKPITSLKSTQGESVDDAESTDSLMKGKNAKKMYENLVPYRTLYRYATKSDVLLMWIGALASILSGAVMPIYAVLFGQLINSLSLNDGNALSETRRFAAFLLILGVISCILALLSFATWSITSQRQVRLIREAYLRSILHQDISWYDSQSPGELSSRLGSDIDMIQAAIGDSVAAALTFISRFFTGIAVGIIMGWQLALIMLCIAPVLVLVGGIFGKFMSTAALKTQKAYADVASLVQEVLSAMRIVSAFNAHRFEINRFSNRLQNALRFGEKRSHIQGIMIGSILMVLYLAYAMTFWFGGWLIFRQTENARTGNPYTGGDVVSVFFGVLMGSFALGQLGPYIPDFTNGRGAAFRIFEIIDRPQECAADAPLNSKDSNIKGDIEFRNIKFHYPSRPDVPVLQGISLKIEAGSTVALVGESGSGKSTCIQLIERFYDPTEGEIVIDDVMELKDIHRRNWREQIALVGQQPVLFLGSIRENLLLAKPSASEADLIEACKAANAHDFISALPDGYDTEVGGLGTEQLSGGQKQRIAIARALLTKPKILLLDEATSALDNKSEKVVQRALDDLISDKIGKKLTCILIAHRLSTVKNADKIFVFSKGKIVEEGTHDELVELEGVYFSLVKSQQSMSDDVEDFKLNGVKKNVNDTEDIEPLDKEVTNNSQDSLLEVKPSLSDGTQIVSKRQWKRIASLLYLDFSMLAFGVIACIIAGAIQPLFSVVLSEMITAFYNPDLKKVRDQADTMALLFVGLAAGQAIIGYAQSALLGYVGERLTYRLRVMMFNSVIRQEVGWFDLPEQNASSLNERINKDAETVRKITSDWIGQFIQILVCGGGGLLIAFITEWRLSLLLMVLAPLIIISGILQMRFFAAKAHKHGGHQKSQALASEAVLGIHTVKSFLAEVEISRRYSQILEIPSKIGIKEGVVTGISLGISQFLLFLTYATSLWFGAYLIDEGKSTFPKVLRVFFSVVLSFQQVGRIVEKSPDIGKALGSLRSVFNLIDRKSSIDPFEHEGKSKIDAGSVAIEFENVKFRYPTRTECLALQSFNLRIEPGKTVALVGFSGSGKSTTVQLLERFYDAESGVIRFGDDTLADVDISHLRSQIGLVSQEPILFNCSILDNIKYSKTDASEDEVIAAAKKANIYDFICSLPSGFNTFVGPRGGQLSGGQRQRIAIARAILRNPKVLLLDEATSALDSESEKLVQHALDEMMKNRTTLIIAHRLSTIQHADLIVVMSGGQVVEQGTHLELVHLQGVYASLLSAVDDSDTGHESRVWK